eukprot:CAMPEP_0198684876 /NCGR_PEP_ID=MMETSP1468-20131203/12838_1 /TAXON_ID=1461545 /ORGANISM="Mantoniella sp, Strain CCMP1436" /LENGTH=167 /DNA_ID=CAMNT_0044430001 /DNA_START=232 /DNA_END=735 /DNA_ORIENTATION=+
MSGAGGGSFSVAGLDRHKISVGKLCFSWFYNMANKAEIEEMLSDSTNTARRRVIGAGLRELTIKYLWATFTGFGFKPPNSCMPVKRKGVRDEPPISFYENRVTDFKSRCKSAKLNHGEAVAPDFTRFQVWRTEHEKDKSVWPLIRPSPVATAREGIAPMEGTVAMEK